MKRKNHLMRAAAVLTALMIGVAALGSCAGQGGANPPSNTAATTAVTNAPAATTSAADTPAADLTTDAAAAWDGTYPIQREAPVKLTYFLQLYSTDYTSAGDLYCWKQAVEQSGVEIEWIHPAAGANATDILNLSLASNDLPDIFSPPDAVGGGVEGLMKMGKLADITDLIETYAPAYMGFIHEYPMMEKSYKQSDGRVIAFKLTGEDYFTQTDGLGVRYDWLEKLNIAAPKTIDDWYNMLKAFKEANPDGIDGEIYPWTSEAKALAVDNTHLMDFATAWGMTGKGLYRDADTGEMTYLTRSPRYIEYVTEMNKWFTEKLVDPEFVTSDAKMFHAKLQTGAAGAAHIFTSGTIGADTAAAKANGKTDFWLQGVPFPIAEGTVTPSGNGYTMVAEQNTFAIPMGPNGTVINAKCENVEAAVAFLNFPYTEKGLELFNYGVEGETFEYVDGERVFMDKILNNPDGKSPATACVPWLVPVIGGHRPMIQAASSQIRFPLPQQKESAKIWAAADRTIAVNTGPLIYSDDDRTALTTILNDIETYRMEMETKIIMGIEPLSKVAEVAAQVEKMDLQKAIDIRTKAYDEYLAKYYE